MRATNAMTSDLQAFVVSSIEARSFHAGRCCVNSVARFHALSRSSVHEKSPQDVSPTGFVARPPSRRRDDRPAASLPDGPDVGKAWGRALNRTTAFDTRARPVHRGLQMARVALARIPSSPLRLAFACSFMILAAIVMIPR